MNIESIILVLAFLAFLTYDHHRRHQEQERTVELLAEGQRQSQKSAAEALLVVESLADKVFSAANPPGRMDVPETEEARTGVSYPNDPPFSENAQEWTDITIPSGVRNLVDSIPAGGTIPGIGLPERNLAGEYYGE